MVYRLSFMSVVCRNDAFPGIFVSPNEVVKQVGSPGMALVIWVLSGLISLTGWSSLHLIFILAPQKTRRHHHTIAIDEITVKNIKV